MTNNEIICPDCQHIADDHDWDEARVGCTVGGCECCHSDEFVRQASRITSLEAELKLANTLAETNGEACGRLQKMVGEQDEVIEKLRESLSDNNAALILATGELQQRGFHVGLVVVEIIKSARTILAETAPKVQS